MMTLEASGVHIKAASRNINLRCRRHVRVQTRASALCQRDAVAYHVRRFNCFRHRVQCTTYSHKRCQSCIGVVRWIVGKKMRDRESTAKWTHPSSFPCRSTRDSCGGTAKHGFAAPSADYSTANEASRRESKNMHNAAE